MHQAASEGLCFFETFRFCKSGFFKKIYKTNGILTVFFFLFFLFFFVFPLPPWRVSFLFLHFEGGNVAEPKMLIKPTVFSFWHGLETAGCIWTPQGVLLRIPFFNFFIFSFPRSHFWHFFPFLVTNSKTMLPNAATAILAQKRA